MPHFKEQPPWEIEWCPKCRLWYGYNNSRAKFSCAVAHAPGDCCHYGQTQLRIEPVKAIGPEGRGDALAAERTP